MIAKKVKLTKAHKCFMFSLSIEQPRMFFIQYNGKVIRISKLLKKYTENEQLELQFNELLQKPILILDMEITVIIIECIYILSYVLNIDLYKYIRFINLNNLITYYLKLI